MECDRFDRLVRALAAVSTRRGLVRLVPALSLAGWFAARLGGEESAADGRRRRRKKRHKHGRPRPHGKRKRQTGKKCKPESPAQTCDGRCGPVRNACQQEVNCGSCDCEPACPACKICDVESRTCQADPATVGADCGAPGEVCQSDGRCACEDNSCVGDCATCGAATPFCRDETCVSCRERCGASCLTCVTTTAGETTCTGSLAMRCQPVCARDEDCVEGEFCANVIRTTDNAPFTCDPLPGPGQGKCVRFDPCD